MEITFNIFFSSIVLVIIFAFGDFNFVKEMFVKVEFSKNIT